MGLIEKGARRDQFLYPISFQVLAKNFSRVRISVTAERFPACGTVEKIQVLSKVMPSQTLTNSRN